MSGHNQTGEQQLKALRCRAIRHATIFYLCLGKTHMEAPPMFRRPFLFWGVSTTQRASFVVRISGLRPTPKRGRVQTVCFWNPRRQLFAARIGAAIKTLSPFAGTIWADIGNRQLFVYVVDSFISRGTVVGVANMTGAKEETITKYFRINKNALHE